MMDGILAVWKPAGWTSHDVVARCRRILKTKRIGHTGTLDPFATGVMVILVGRATRLAQFLDRDVKEYEAVAQVVQSMAAEAGFDMKIRVTEFATSLKQAEAGDYQAYMLAWSGRVDPDGNSYVFLHSSAPQNYSAWNNPEADKALDDARLVTDQAQRKAIYAKLTKLVLDEEPILYIFHRHILIAHTTKLEGYKQMPDGLVRVVGVTLK